MSFYGEIGDYEKNLEYEKMKFKTFIQFLTESNHGIYNKDRRLKYLTKLIYESIRDKVNTLHNKFENISDKIYDIELERLAPSKNRDPVEIDISWSIRYIEQEHKTTIYKKAQATYRFYHGQIEIVLIKSGVNHPEFLQEVKAFVEEDLNVILYHEVKHILDRIDRKLIKGFGKEPSQDDIINGKYQSHDSEIHNFLLSIIGEIEGIVKRNPDLSYSEVIKLSKTYHKYLPPMETSKQNMIKGKLVDFWIETYGKKSLH